MELDDLIGITNLINLWCGDGQCAKCNQTSKKCYKEILFKKLSILEIIESKPISIVETPDIASPKPNYMMFIYNVSEEEADFLKDMFNRRLEERK